VHELSSGNLPENAREELRNMLTSELVERGLAQNDEPTPWGLEVESLIDMIGEK
jgi:hypothetical protein